MQRRRVRSAWHALICTTTFRRRSRSNPRSFEPGIWQDSRPHSVHATRPMSHEGGSSREHSAAPLRCRSTSDDQNRSGTSWSVFCRPMRKQLFKAQWRNAPDAELCVNFREIRVHCGSIRRVHRARRGTASHSGALDFADATAYCCNKSGVPDEVGLTRLSCPSFGDRQLWRSINGGRFRLHGKAWPERPWSRGLRPPFPSAFCGFDGDEAIVLLANPLRSWIVARGRAYILRVFAWSMVKDKRVGNERNSVSG